MANRASRRHKSRNQHPESNRFLGDVVWNFKDLYLVGMVLIVLLVLFLNFPFFSDSSGPRQSHGHHQHQPHARRGPLKRNRRQEIPSEDTRSGKNKPPRSDSHDLTPTDSAMVRSIYLLGERNSGTNFIEQTLFQAFPQYATSNHSRYPYSFQVPVLGYKHIWRPQHSLLTATELETFSTTVESNHGLLVLVVRRPCQWADAMRRTPWHLCPPPSSSTTTNNTRVNHSNDTTKEKVCNGHFYIGLQAKNQTRKMSNQEFFTLPWNDWKERNVSLLVNTTESSTIPPSFDNVFALRAYKLALLHQLVEWNAHQTSNNTTTAAVNRVVVLHLRDFEANPHRVIRELAQRFGLRVASTYYKHMGMMTRSPWDEEDGIMAWGGRPPIRKNKQHLALCLSPSESKLAHSLIDWDLERQFGFIPTMECQPCSMKSTGDMKAVRSSGKRRKMP